MTERLHMLCVKPDRPVDPITVSIMREIDAVAKELNLPYFLVGAMARDVLLGHVYRNRRAYSSRRCSVTLAQRSGLSTIWRRHYAVERMQYHMQSNSSLNSPGDSPHKQSMNRERQHHSKLDVLEVEGAQSHSCKCALASSQEFPADVVQAFPLLVAESRIRLAFLPDATRKLRRSLF